jgi:hypothetical protein
MQRFRLGLSLTLVALLALGLVGSHPKTTRAEPRYMFLTVTDFEVGISYRQAQWHAPIGQLIVPCSYADHFAATIDWNDGTGEHKPDANVEKKMVQTVPAVQSGTYLFWDDEHVFKTVGTQIVTTKLLIHCVGDPPGDQEYAYRNVVKAYARIPVNQIEFTKDGKSVTKVKGHDRADLTITLGAPAPPSGTWVKLDVSPAGNLNTLPPYVQVAQGQTQQTIPNLELRNPNADIEIRITASTVGRAQESQNLTVTQ